MLVKIYWGLWTATACTALLMYLTGTMTMTAIVAIGFVAFGLTFMGMMSVLPSIVAHATHPEPEASPAKATIRDRIDSYRGSLTQPPIAVRKPKFP